MLKRVSIQNFKSLKDVTLNLQKVNLLIGPNNSGKTNFLKALEFMSKIETNVNVEVPDQLLFRPATIPYATGEKLYRNAVNEYVSIYLVHQSPFFSGRYDNSKLYAKPKSEEIKQEEKAKYYVIEGIETDKVDYDFGDKINDPSTESGNFKQLKYIHLENLRIYKPDPNKFDKPSPIGKGDELVNADASNLVGFLDLMLSKYRRTTFNQIEADLHTCVPEFDEINLDDAKPTEELKKQFGDKSFKRLGLTNSKQNITYWADELSEGTLYFLALLCIINQPNPPKLLLLEEPEKGIHPRRIEEVINFIFGLADDKDVQVIMTTHSPAVVDMFKDMPESVFIFDKDDEGATHVKNLQKDIIEPETAESEKAGFDPPRYLNGLGEAWKVGFLGGVPR